MKKAIATGKARLASDQFSSRLRNDEVKINKLLKRVQSPTCSRSCFRKAGKDLADLALDVRLIMDIRRRMLTRSR